MPAFTHCPCQWLVPVVRVLSYTQNLEVYKLPEQIGRQVTEQYERDVARVHGGEVVHSDAEYKKFLSTLGGAPPPELMGLDANGTCAASCPLGG